MSGNQNIKTKVLIISLPLDNQNAGVHVYTKELVSAINNHANPDIEFTLIRTEKQDEYPNLETIIIPNLFWIPGWATFTLFILIPIITILNKINVSIEPAHFGPFNLPRPIKRVTVIHDLTPIIFPEHHRVLSRMLQKIYLKNILSKADLILSNSINTQTDLEQYYPITKGKIKTIYLGISAHFKNLKPNPIHIENLNIKTPYLLFVGTIEPRKNLILLLDAFTKLKADPKFNHKLYIAGGKGWKSEAFYSHLNNHKFRDEIYMLDFVKNEELVSLYSYASVFVYPSLYEGFGFPPLEAIYCGSKSVIPYNSSLVEIGKDLAHFYYEQSVDSISEAILSAISAENDPVKSRELIDKRFNWSEHAKIFQETLISLVNNG